MQGRSSRTRVRECKSPHLVRETMSSESDCYLIKNQYALGDQAVTVRAPDKLIEQGDL